MLDRIRGEQGGVWALGVALFVLAVALIALWATYSGVYEAVYHDYAAAKEQAERQRQFAEKCGDATTVDSLRRCIEEQIKADRPTQRAEEDLYAQKQMAQWAFWMLVVAGAVGVITITVTAIGVWYVAKTLEATRRGANYAKEMAVEARKTTDAAIRAADEAHETTKAAIRAADEAEKTTEASRTAANAAAREVDLAQESYERLERPYLFIKFGDFNRLRDSRESVPFIRYTLVNHGRTPAILHSIATELVPDPEHPLRVPMDAHDRLYQVIEPDGQLPGERVQSVKGSSAGHNWSGKAAKRLIFHGLIQYHGPTGDLHSDRFCMRCRENADGFSLEGGTKYNYRVTERAKQPGEII